MIDRYTGKELNPHQLAAIAERKQKEHWAEENAEAGRRLAKERAEEKRRQKAVGKLELIAARKELETSLERRLRAAGPISEAEIQHLLPRLLEAEILRRAAEPETTPPSYTPLH